MPSLSPPPRLSQGTPTAALQLAPPDVQALVTRLGLSADIVRAELLAYDCFPSDGVVSVEKVGDRESEAEWLAVRVTVRTTPDVAGEAYATWLEAWLGFASPTAVDAVTLTFAVV